jgi:hypothetical protein
MFAFAVNQVAFAHWVRTFAFLERFAAIGTLWNIVCNTVGVGAFAFIVKKFATIALWQCALVGYTIFVRALAVFAKVAVTVRAFGWNIVTFAFGVWAFAVFIKIVVTAFVRTFGRFDNDFV